MSASASPPGAAERPFDLRVELRAKEPTRHAARDSGRDLDAVIGDVIGTVGLRISATLWLARSARLGSEELVTRLVEETFLAPPAEPRRGPTRARA